MTKKPKEGYSSVLGDICTTLISMPENVLRDANDRIIQTAEMRVVKLRIPNTGLKQAKANGFRLVYLISSSLDDVVLLTIYPQRGAKGIINIPSAEYVRLLKTFAEENQTKALHQIDIANSLQELSQCASLR